MKSKEVYIGFIHGKGLFHAYEKDIEYGIAFFMDKNLGKLIKEAISASRLANIKLTPKVCFLGNIIF